MLLVQLSLQLEFLQQIPCQGFKMKKEGKYQLAPFTRSTKYSIDFSRSGEFRSWQHRDELLTTFLKKSVSQASFLVLQCSVADHLTIYLHVSSTLLEIYTTPGRALRFFLG